MSQYVLDASVVVKWVIEEPFQEEARHYRHKELTLLAPGLLLLECASAIQKKVWRNELESEEGWQAYEVLCAYEELNIIPTSALMRQAYDIANELSHSIYDCLYLALAVQNGATVITADKKFFDQVKKSTYKNRIAWIEDPPEFPDQTDSATESERND